MKLFGRTGPRIKAKSKYQTIPSYDRSPSVLVKHGTFSITPEEHIEDTHAYIAELDKHAKIALGEAAIIMERMAHKETQEKPWHFLETGAVSGAISLRPAGSMKNADDHITVWSAKHEAETPIFFQAVREHNVKINAERRKKKNELQPF